MTNEKCQLALGVCHIPAVPLSNLITARLYTVEAGLGYFPVA